ncbi:hypothetical protein HLH34_18710 [Gluconacetobacter azotocaptans]|uniref:Uncharacterized protein n=1 Tax=Gluconacetobacter azotocaptans TaxID=142834 RepID=A0A7W4JW14_9PROT|nr:hypothetical protein [Gluconacetobacter azotocaptans]MBB2191966.1 hypothetical protein [Gluconacetobacter azotocaptans]
MMLERRERSLLSATWQAGWGCLPPPRDGLDARKNGRRSEERRRGRARKLLFKIERHEISQPARKERPRRRGVRIAIITKMKYGVQQFWQTLLDGPMVFIT